MLRSFLQASIAKGCKTAVLVLLITGSLGVFAQAAYAAPPAPREIDAGDTPQVSQCDRWTAYLLQTTGPDTHSISGGTYKVTVYGYQGYDTTFGLWCNEFQSEVKLEVTGNTNGSISEMAGITNCGGSTYKSNTQSYGNGTYTVYVTSPWDNVQSGFVESVLKVAGNTWTDQNTGCYGN